MTTSERRRIVIIGAGPAGIGAADELVRALAEPGAPDVEVVVLEGREQAGGRARGLRLDDAEHAALWPSAPVGTGMPTGAFVVGDDDVATRSLLEEDRLGPDVGPPLLVLRAPDVIGGARARQTSVLAFAPVDPARQGTAKREQTRALLSSLAAGSCEELVPPLAELGIDLEACAPWGDVWFAQEELSVGCRWTLAAASSLTARGASTTDDAGSFVLAGMDVVELQSRLYERIARGLATAASALEAIDSDHPLTRLALADAERLPHERFDAATSRVLTLLTLDARSGPEGVDAKTALVALARAARVGGRRVIDGAAAGDVWSTALARVEDALDTSDRGHVQRGAWVTQLLQVGDAVTGVELTDNAAFSAPPVPFAQPARKGLPTQTLEADAVISAVPPAALLAQLRLVDGAAQERFCADLAQLGRAADEGVSVLLAFDREVELGLPVGHAVVRGLAGPLSTLIDLRRAWSEDALRRLRLLVDGRAARSAWLLCGDFASAFADDAFGLPRAAREVLRGVTQEVDKIDPAALEERYEVDAALGDVRAMSRTAWLERWVEEAAPFIAGRALRAVATLPNLEPVSREGLLEQAEGVTRQTRSGVRWAVWRGGAYEQRRSSAAPSLAALRPSAGEACPIRGLFCAGDWTAAARDEPAVPGVEAAIASGRAAARAALRSLAAREPQAAP